MTRGGARRILVIIENVPYARDHRARKQVESLLRSGYRVGVISRRDPDNHRYRSPGLRIYDYQAPPERSGLIGFALEYCYSLAAATALMLRARRDGRVDLVQTGHPPDIYFLLAVPARLLGARFVVDQRDLSPEVYADRFGKTTGAIPKLLRAMERASHRVADGVLCVNDSLARTVMTRGKVDAEKVTVIGNGPTLVSVEGHPPVPELRAGFDRLVCWHGVMGPQDHVELAISAAAHYIHELGREDTLFVFMGSGESLDAARKMAADLCLGDRVRFTGWLEEGQLLRLPRDRRPGPRFQPAARGDAGQGPRVHGTRPALRRLRPAGDPRHGRVRGAICAARRCRRDGTGDRAVAGRSSPTPGDGRDGARDHPAAALLGYAGASLHRTGG